MALNSDPIRFTKGSAEKIQAAVKRTRMLSADNRGRRRAREIRRPGFWIELTAEGTGSDVGWYSWKMVHPNATNPVTWTDHDPEIASELSELNAREANDRSGLAATEPARYFVHSIGFDPEDDDKPIYLFHAGALPTGQIQHQAYLMVTQHAAGWSQRLAVPDLVEVET